MLDKINNNLKMAVSRAVEIYGQLLNEVGHVKDKIVAISNRNMKLISKDDIFKKINSEYRIILLSGKKVYGQLLESVGPVKEQALVIADKAIKQLSSAQKEIQKYAHEITRSASRKLNELQKSLDLINILKKLAAKLNKIYAQTYAKVGSVAQNTMKSIKNN